MDYNPENKNRPYYPKLLELFNSLKGRNPFSSARSLWMFRYTSNCETDNNIHSKFFWIIFILHRSLVTGKYMVKIQLDFSTNNKCWTATKYFNLESKYLQVFWKSSKFVDLLPIVGKSTITIGHSCILLRLFCAYNLREHIFMFLSL